MLVVNADDFGFTHDVNRGIIEAHTHGILTATTLMANGIAFADAVRLAREHPSLDVGCHFVLVGGESLAAPGKRLPATLPQLLKAIALREINPYVELKSQAQKIVDAGLRPLHLDTHKHTHLLPPVLHAVTRLSQEFGIPWVRRPFDFPLSGTGHVPWTKRALSQSMQGLRNSFHRKLAKHQCRTTDYFAGFQITGSFRIRELVALISALPEGTTELMTHPGFCGDELRASPTRLKESRYEELQALTSREVSQALSEHAVRLVRYGQL